MSKEVSCDAKRGVWGRRRVLLALRTLVQQSWHDKRQSVDSIPKELGAISDL